MSEPKKSFPISRFLQGVKRLITEKIPEVWVHGVISQLTVRDRMCYLTLAEYTENDVRPVATLGLFLYTMELDSLNAKLSNLPKPFQLAVDLKVSVLVRADFYVPQGKFQAHLLDIDPVFTLGELALTRQAILKRLDQEGLRTRNSQLCMPPLPLKVGLVTAPGSAAYHDFMNVLSQSGYAFEVITAGARMQGNETESSVLAAFGSLLQHKDLDVLCIVRGGGSKTDLNYFDSEALCRSVALAPMPVLAGIGHEIDQSLVDMVAWRSCITPTDTAKFLVGCVDASWVATEQLVLSIAKHARLRLERERGRHRQVAQGLSRALPGRMAQEQERIRRSGRELRRSVQLRLQAEHATWLRNRQGLGQGVLKIIGMAELSLAPWKGRLQQSYSLRAQQASMHLEILTERVKAADPERVVRRGFSLTLDAQGRAVTHKDQVAAGSQITTRFAWGEVRSKVLP